MKYYDLNDSDLITINGYEFEFKNATKEEIIESSQAIPKHSKSSMEMESSIIYVPETQDVSEQIVYNTETEDIEIPETQLESVPMTIENQTNNLHVNVNEASVIQEETDTEIIPDEESEQVESTDDEDSQFSDDQFGADTLPLNRLPNIKTRARQQKQERTKPKTRNMNEFECTQFKQEKYMLETQPYFPIKMKSSLPIKTENSSRKVFSKLPLSDSSDSDERKTLPSPLLEKRNSKGRLGKIIECSVNLQKIKIDHDHDILNNSSQSFDDEFLNLVNLSQEKSDSILEFKDEVESSKSITASTSKRSLDYNPTEKQIQKRRKRFKLMKYGSDENME